MPIILFPGLRASIPSPCFRSKMMKSTTPAKRNKLTKLNLPVSMICLGLVLLGFPKHSAAQQPVKVFILAGQSNMEGQGEIYASAGPRAQGSLEYEVKNDTSGI